MKEITRKRRLEILESLVSTLCGGCGKSKRPKMSHCRSCYYTLPPKMRQALYQGFGCGYEEAYEESLGILERQTKMRFAVEGGAPVDRGFVIYERPSDYPANFVVRPFSIIEDADELVLLQPQVAWLADSLEEARALVPPGLTCIGCAPSDGRQIVETWL